MKYPDKVELLWGHALKSADYWSGLEGRVGGNCKSSPKPVVT
ncbi:hypothetical protein [Cystobacter fuscus]